MADSITDDDDLAGIMTANDLTRLTPSTWADMTEFHEKAWADVKLHFANRPDPITEDMMSDTTELIPAVIHNVAMQAFTFGRDIEMAKHHRGEYLRQLNLIRPSVTSTDGESGTAHGWGGTIELELG